MQDEKETYIGVAIDTEEKYEWLMKSLGLPIVKPTDCPYSKNCPYDHTPQEHCKDLIGFEEFACKEKK